MVRWDADLIDGFVSTELPLPGAAPRPRTSGSPSCTPGPEVTGRDCSIQTSPAVSNAHSVSCGAP